MNQLKDIQNSRELDAVFRQMNYCHIIPSSFFKIPFNNKPPSLPRTFNIILYPDFCVSTQVQHVLATRVNNVTLFVLSLPCRPKKDHICQYVRELKLLIRHVIKRFIKDVRIYM